MRILSTFFVLIFFVASPVFADDMSVAGFEKELRDMNRVKPLQDHRYKQLKDILDSRILDKTNRVIGTVEDVTFNVEGGVEAVVADLDRLQLGESIPLSLSDINVVSMSKGYRFDIAASEIEDLYPMLLANIATASGGDLQVLSVNGLIGGSISSDKFTNFAEVTDILFDTRATSVHAIFATVNYRTIRKKGIALPIEAFDFMQENGRMKIMIKEGLDDSLIDYAKNN